MSGDPRLDRAATDHSQDMVDRGYFSHQSPEGTWHWDRMEAAGFPGNSTGNGENLGCGAAPVSPFDIFVTWQRSDSHNRNMLMADWRVAGIGVVASDACSGGYGATVTSLFATSPGDAIECGSETAALAQAKRKVAAAKRAKARAASAKRRATTRLARRKAARRLRAKRVALKRAVNTKRAARQALAECRGD